MLDKVKNLITPTRRREVKKESDLREVVKQKIQKKFEIDSHEAGRRLNESILTNPRTSLDKEHQYLNIAIDGFIFHVFVASQEWQDFIDENADTDVQHQIILNILEQRFQLDTIKIYAF